MRVLRIAFLLFILALIGCIPLKKEILKPSFLPKAERYVLPNGLVVILKEFHTSPTVALQAWVKAGLTSEGEYIGSGISHFVEHMLFKGTKKRKVGEVAREIRAAGGEIRGYTSFDYTVYEIEIGSKYLSVALDVLGDVLMHSSFEEKELEREREVILKEIMMGEDDPERVLSRIFWGEAFRVHPYRHPVIGYREVFEKIGRDDILKYYKRMYVPNNIVLVAVGDFETNKVLGKIKEVFADFKRTPIHLPPPPKEPPQIGIRKVERELDVEVTRMIMGFHIPSATSPDVYPLDILAVILGQGRSSRFHIKLKEEKQLVYEISAFSYTPRYPGIFGISSTFEPGKEREVVEEICAELEKLKWSAPSREELKRAKKKILSDYIFSRETASSQARAYGCDEVVVGNYRFSREYIRRIGEVKPKDIQEVVKKYFKNNYTVALVKPKEVKEKEERVRDRKWKPGEIKKFVLKNGMTLLLRKNSALPIIHIQAVFLGGVRVESALNNGVCNLMRRMLLKGTTNMGAEEISKRIEEKGGSIDTFCGRNSFGVSLSILKEDFDEGLRILKDIIINPTFPPEELEEERRVVLAEIKAEEEDVFVACERLLMENMWRVHPYRFRIIGTEESIKKIEREHLLQFHRKYCRPENLVVAVFGDIKVEEVLEKVKRAFTNFKGEGKKKIKVPLEPPQRKMKKVVMHKDMVQAVIFIGFHGVNIKNSDRFVLDVIANLLSGQGGRLFEELRGKRALAYAVGCYSILGIDPGAFIFYISTSPKEVEEAIQGIMGEVENLRMGRISNEELERAKRNLVGKKMLQLQTNSSQAFEAALSELYGLGYNSPWMYSQFVQEVSLEDVKRVANLYLQPNNCTLAILKPR